MYACSSLQILSAQVPAFLSFGQLDGQAVVILAKWEEDIVGVNKPSWSPGYHGSISKSKQTSKHMCLLLFKPTCRPPLWFYHSLSATYPMPSAVRTPGGNYSL